jgi:pyridoxamine 5'-phosphate oxidase family protein
MALTHAEQAFLTRQPRGHLATIGPDGSPQVKPVGFTYNSDLGTIDIAGFNMGASAKFRNIQARPHVAFVVDEVTADNMDGAHFLEVRGVAEAAMQAREPGSHLAPELIRIHPRRVLAFNVDPDQPGLQARAVSPDESDPKVA